MINVPVTFEFKGEAYSGCLSQVIGAGSTAMFYLMIDRFYYGRLRHSDFQGAWVFDTNKGSMGWEILAEYFGYIVISWNDSH